MAFCSILLNLTESGVTKVYILTRRKLYWLKRWEIMKEKSSEIKQPFAYHRRALYSEHMGQFSESITKEFFDKILDLKPRTCPLIDCAIIYPSILRRKRQING